MSNPSLILPQSPAYGEDYVYAAQVYDGEVPVYDVLPLTFTRASGGSRINKDGLVQNMPYNLVEQSETFTNGYWYTNNVTINANAVTAPNGFTTAENAVTTASDSYISSSTAYGIVPLQTYTQSIYVKWVSGYENFMIRSVFFGGTGVYSELVVNARYGTFISCNNTYQIENAGNGWFRISQQLTNTDNLTAGYQIYPTVGITQTSVISIWGAQVNIGSTAQPYLATTDRLNMPRITYPVGGGCGALLLEKQSTNLCLYSEQLNDSYWIKSNTTITANNTISPDGTQNADLVLETTATSNHAAVSGLININSGTSYTFSTYAKNGSGGRGLLQIGAYQLTGAFQDGFVNFDLINGTITRQTQATGKIENIGNGWYRCSMSFASTLTVAERINLTLINSPTAVFAPVYTGDTSKGLYLWGAQVEASSYATSYISTTSASSTRIADACYKTGISNLIGQTEGTWFVDTYVGNETDEVYGWLQASLSGNPNDSIQINRANTNIQCQVYVGGSVQGIITGGTITKGQRIKVAIGYKANDLVLYLNGTQIGTDTSTGIPACSLIQIGAYPPLLNDYTADGGINNVILYKTRLTNAELATLTTL